MRPTALGRALLGAVALLLAIPGCGCRGGFFEPTSHVVALGVPILVPCSAAFGQLLDMDAAFWDPVPTLPPSGCGVASVQVTPGKGGLNLLYEATFVRTIHLVHEPGAQARTRSSHATPGPLGSSNLSCGQPAEFDFDGAMWVAAEQPVDCPQHLTTVTLIDDHHATVGVSAGVSLPLEPVTPGPSPALLSSAGSGSYTLVTTPCGTAAVGQVEIAGTAYRAAGGLPPERAGDCYGTETAVLFRADRLVVSTSAGASWALKRHEGRIVRPCG